jgi:hypothetical protein
MPDQVASQWDVLKFAIENSLPPIVGGRLDRMNNILNSLLVESMHAWVSCTIHGNGADPSIEGVVVTTFTEDGCSGTRNLLIYCLYAFNRTFLESWQDGISTLLKYAQSKGCSRIIGYTDVEAVVKRVEALGGETKYRLISFPVETV